MNEQVGLPRFHVNYLQVEFVINTEKYDKSTKKSKSNRFTRFLSRKQSYDDNSTDSDCVDGRSQYSNEDCDYSSEKSKSIDSDQDTIFETNLALSKPSSKTSVVNPTMKEKGFNSEMTTTLNNSRSSWFAKTLSPFIKSFKTRRRPKKSPQDTLNSTPNSRTLIPVDSQITLVDSSAPLYKLPEKKKQFDIDSYIPMNQEKNEKLIIPHIKIEERELPKVLNSNDDEIKLSELITPSTTNYNLSEDASKLKPAVAFSVSTVSNNRAMNRKSYVREELPPGFIFKPIEKISFLEAKDNSKPLISSPLRTSWSVVDFDNVNHSNGLLNEYSNSIDNTFIDASFCDEDEVSFDDNEEQSNASTLNSKEISKTERENAMINYKLMLKSFSKLLSSDDDFSLSRYVAVNSTLKHCKKSWSECMDQASKDSSASIVPLVYGERKSSLIYNVNQDSIAKAAEPVEINNLYSSYKIENINQIENSLDRVFNTSWSIYENRDV